MPSRLSLPAARKQRNDRYVRSKLVEAQKILSRQLSMDGSGQRMTYVRCIHSPSPKPSFLERKQTKKLADTRSNLTYAASPPGPHLRCNQIINRNTEALEVTRKP
jgi:hypothetical protein